MQKVLRYFTKALEVNKSRGFTLVELLIVIVIIGILAALSTREYSKYIERSNLNTYALPLARDCFIELAEYCAANPGNSSINAVILPAFLGTNSTCDRLNSTDGISTAKGIVKMESGFPNSCNQYGTPNYSRDIVVTLSSASRYKLVCVPRLVEAIGSGQNTSQIKAPECSIQPR